MGRRGALGRPECGGRSPQAVSLPGSRGLCFSACAGAILCLTWGLHQQMLRGQTGLCARRAGSVEAPGWSRREENQSPCWGAALFDTSPQNWSCHSGRSHSACARLPMGARHRGAGAMCLTCRPHLAQPDPVVLATRLQAVTWSSTAALISCPHICPLM